LKFLKRTSVNCGGVATGTGVAAEDKAGVVLAGDAAGGLVVSGCGDVAFAGCSGSSCADKNEETKTAVQISGNRVSISLRY
jgi:hypothetical protein